MASTKTKKTPTKKERAAKAPAKSRKSQSVLAGDDSQSEDSDLPKDETGRRKIKRQYETLLGIRIEKLKGRILNRERINKTIEGVYFICARCKKVCHNMDDGLVEDPNNVKNVCGSCEKPKKDTKRKQAAA